jgi:hypothetical protein
MKQRLKWRAQEDDLKNFYLTFLEPWSLEELDQGCCFEAFVECSQQVKLKLICQQGALGNHRTKDGWSETSFYKLSWNMDVPTVALMRGGVGEGEKETNHIASNTCFPFYTVVSLSCLLSWLEKISQGFLFRSSSSTQLWNFHNSWTSLNILTLWVPLPQGPSRSSCC